MASSDIKGFYRQRKSGGGGGGGRSKKSPSISNSGSRSTRAHGGVISLGSDPAQPPALISHASLDLKDDYDKNEEVLRHFDMNMNYGPCLGLSRLERWERADKLGLNPPKEVEKLLKGSNVGLVCLWDGRI